MHNENAITGYKCLYSLFKYFFLNILSDLMPDSICYAVALDYSEVKIFNVQTKFSD